MKNFFKSIFSTRYRIYPIYESGKQAGYIVYERCWLSPIYTAANMDWLTSNGTDLISDKATFKTNDEAVAFIKSRLKTYTYETIQTD